METSTKEWRVYKPKKTNDGAASKLQMRVEEQEKETEGFFLRQLRQTLISRVVVLMKRSFRSLLNRFASTVY
jgi:hypothetical protein